MKFCSQCGAANENDMTVCYECGAMLEAESGYTGKTKGSFRIPKPVLIIVGLVLVVGLIVGGIVLALSGRETGLETAWGRTYRDFVGGKEEPTQFRQFFITANERLAEGEYTLYAAFSGGQTELDLSTDYSRSAKELRGEVSLGGFNLDFSAKNKVIQVQFPGTYEVYGFNVDDINKVTETFNKLLNMPFVGEVMPISLPTDLELDLFAKTDLEGMLEGVAGEEYQAFLDSVEIETWNDETITLNGRDAECSVYKISWKSEAATELLGALGSGGFLPNVGGLVNSLLPEMDPYVYCYIHDEALVGARFTAAGAKCFFLLEGGDNLWDQFSLTAQTVSGETKVFRGAMVRSGDAFELYLQDDAGLRVITVDYDDDSGDFAVSTLSAGTLVTGQVTGKVGEAGIRLYWTLPEAGQQELSWTITRLRSQPQQLGEKYSDLMDMAWSVLESILIDWMIN